jgi:L-lactate dehydrogenase complex protein LldG
MKVSPAKENILKRIRQALTHNTQIPFPHSEGQRPIFPPLTQDLGIEFAESFTRIQGRFVYCANSAELGTAIRLLIEKEGWKQVFCREPELVSGLAQAGLSGLSSEGLESCQAAITGCELLVARTGSIVLTASQPSGRTVSVYAPVHICVAYSSQLVSELRDALQLLKERHGRHFPSQVSFATGPSRTADIEKTLVVGVHGPRAVYVFLVDEPKAP